MDREREETAFHLRLLLRCHFKAAVNESPRAPKSEPVFTASADKYFVVQLITNLLNWSPCFRSCGLSGTDTAQHQMRAAIA